MAKVWPLLSSLVPSFIWTPPPPLKPPPGSNIYQLPLEKVSFFFLCFCPRNSNLSHASDAWCARVGARSHTTSFCGAR